MSSILCLLLLLWIPAIVEPYSYCESGTQRVKCVHGTCQNDSTVSSTRCLCDRGWGGPSCDACGGRVNINLTDDRPGYITDGVHNYTLETKCTWLITSDNSSPIQLSFQHFATECSWDHLYVYDGNSVFDPLVATYSGLVLPGNEPGGENHVPDITITSGSAIIHFYSDAAYNMSGFNITYRRGSCPKQCSGHGKCLIEKNYTCECDGKWSGPACDIPMCPNDCSRHGTCSDPTPGVYKCGCEQGFNGIDCSIPESKGYWEQIEYTTFTADTSTSSHSSQIPQDTPPHGRASHKSVLIDNEIWTVGGYDFNTKTNDTMTLLKYYVISKDMEIITPSGKLKPRPRYGHSVVVYERHLVMYGGIIGKEITDEMWIYNLSSNSWISISSELVSSYHPGNTFYAVVGHTAHLIDGIMYVVFGHSALYGYMNTVQECNMSNYKWKVPSANGAIVQGGYGHTSVYDPETKKIYVYAGYHSGSTSAYHLSNDMYSYDPHTKHWRILKSSKVFANPQYLHSAVLSDGLILVFGGNTHNDTARSLGAKCFSSTFLAYDIECDQWYTLDKPVLDKDISRFGHTAIMYTYELKESASVFHYMHVLGGFNGLTMMDMYKYTPGNCNQHNDRESCLGSREGVICWWVDDKLCLKKADAQRRKAIQIKDKLTCPTPTEEEMKRECKSFSNCLSCVENPYNCSWCDNTCQYNSCQKKHATNASTCLSKFPENSRICVALHNCRACSQVSYCHWEENPSKCEYRGEQDATNAANTKRSVEEESSNLSAEEQCAPSCASHTSCENCSAVPCMWCSSEQRCVDLNAYVASFPYGQCMEWITSPSKCNETRCSALRTCEACQSNPFCGWCDDGTNTGLGHCITGGLDGPVVSDQSSEDRGNSSEDSRNSAVCGRDSWYFAECPVCQCNGHSTCFENTGKCIECEDFTVGSQCQYCKEGYYGIPTNGGNCTECECNGQADHCSREEGSCYCRTQGMTGRNCNECNKSDKYYGDPQNGGTCFYELTTGYKFTFDMSKAKDWHYTRINFLNKPEDHRKDIEFQINCSTSAKVNITLSTSSGAEQVVESDVSCGIFKRKFNHKKYKFGKKYNSTIYVYVYDFKTPFMVLVSFSQHHPIDLLHFFVTFFSCFLTLLLVAAVLWKVKQKYDVYRRNQRMKVTRAQWASRPFAKCTIEVDPNPDVQLQCKRDPLDQKRAAKCKVKNATRKPSYIAIQPMQNFKAAVVSVVIHLPTGDEEYAPPCQSGVAIGASLVSLGNNQRSLVEQMKSDKGLKTQKTTGADSKRCPQYVV